MNTDSGKMDKMTVSESGKGNLIYFKDIKMRRQARDTRAPELVALQLLDKLDLLRLRLIEREPRTRDILPLIQSMKMERKRLTDCRSPYNRELDEIIAGVIQVTDTELEAFEKGCYC